ncbi:hypothetical protein NC652_026905 [Populus alba x Populus x berolinensis]|nr:hypothetical protein NC652_026905 [Populus alba x Populus x berolinensis]
MKYSSTLLFMIADMLPGLQQGQEKMSKSDPSSSIFIEDEEVEVKTKIKKAYCPPQIVEGNPCLEYIKHIVLPWFNKFKVERNPENGGEKIYESFEELVSNYESGGLHSGDLKPALARALNMILQPVRDHFSKDPNANDLLKRVKNVSKKMNHVIFLRQKPLPIYYDGFEPSGRMHIAFPWFNKFKVERNPENGGEKIYESFEELVSDYESGGLHSSDLKPALARALNMILQPVRDHFSKDPNANDLFKRVKVCVKLLSLEKRFQLVRSVGEECIQEDEPRHLLERKPLPICYDGFEPSGRMHIVFPWFNKFKVERNPENGGEKLLSLEKRFQLVRSVGEECIQEDEPRHLLERKPLPICYDGFEPSRRMHIVFPWFNKFKVERNPENGGEKLLSLEKRFQLVRSVGEECIQEDEPRHLLERKPLPICYDGFEPSGRMHIVLPWFNKFKVERNPENGGEKLLSLEKRFQLVRSVGEECIQEDEPRHLLERKPLPICYDGFEPSRRMHIVFPWFNKFKVERNPENGGEKIYESFEELVSDYESGGLHSGDLKPALARALNMILQPVRDHFSKDPNANDLLKRVKVCVKLLSLDKRFQLVRSVGEECIQEDEPRHLLERKPLPICYDGFEPSGRMHIVLPWFNKFKVERNPENGGEKIYESFEELVSNYESGGLHSGDLKPALARALNMTAVRDHFSKDPKANDLLKRVKLLSLEKRFQLVRSVGEDASKKMNHVIFLRKKPLSICYDGFEPSGRMHIVLPWFNKFKVERNPENGGEKIYESFEELVSDYESGGLHSGDLKPALARALNMILQVSSLCGNLHGKKVDSHGRQLFIYCA